MRRILPIIALLLTCIAFASPVALIIDGKTSTLEGIVVKDVLYVALPQFLQAIGGGARPVKFDLSAQTIVLTKGDGKLQVPVSIQLKDGQLYVAALEAARGLGFSASLKDATLTLTARATTDTAPAPTTGALYPQGFEASQFESVAQVLIDELDGNAKDSPNLEAILDGSGVPVYGTTTKPADADELDIFLALHHPFASALELFTLRAGFQHRFFTRLEDFFAGLSDRGATSGSSTSGGATSSAGAISPDRAPGLVAGLFDGPPSRSQVVFALVGAIGRERVKRGITLSSKRDRFWGDDALDPVQLRLLDAVLTSGPGPESRIAGSSVLPADLRDALTPAWMQNRKPDLERRPNPTVAYGAQMIQIPTRVAGEALVVQHMMSDVADKAVKQSVKEAYPGAAEWVDNQVQDKLGIPIVLPISPELLEATLKGDTSQMAKLWSGLLRTAGIETVKEGGRVALCGSITLYGYLTKFEADPLEIHHRTDAEAEGKSLSKLKLSIYFNEDYRKKVFNDTVQIASRLAVKNPPKNAAELLERLGCQVPEPGPAKEKTVDWELTGDLEPHAESGVVQFADKTTNANGEAKAQLRAIDEHTPKAFRLSKQSATGVIFVNVRDLLPHKWWRIEAAVQYGQDVKDGNSAGTATNRLKITYFEPPKLTLKFQSTVSATTKDGAFKFVMESEVPLEAKFSGDPTDPRSRFLGYGGADRLRYLSRSLQSKCAKIADVAAGILNVWVTSESFENPQITAVLNPIQNPPLETYTPTNAPDCPAGQPGQGAGWLSLFLEAHNLQSEVGALQGGAPGSVPGNAPQYGLIARENKQNTNVMYRKTYQRSGIKLNGGTMDENTEITLEVRGK